MTNPRFVGVSDETGGVLERQSHPRQCEDDFDGGITPLVWLRLSQRVSWRRVSSRRRASPWRRASQQRVSSQPSSLQRVSQQPSSRRVSLRLWRLASSLRASWRRRVSPSRSLPSQRVSRQQASQPLSSPLASQRVSLQPSSREPLSLLASPLVSLLSSLPCRDTPFPALESDQCMLIPQPLGNLESVYRYSALAAGVAFWCWKPDKH
jgi:hypothetical protein